MASAFSACDIAPSETLTTFADLWLAYAIETFQADLGGINCKRPGISGATGGITSACSYDASLVSSVSSR